jgi:hypothetical protein
MRTTERKSRTKQEILAKIYYQVTHLPDIRLRLMESNEPPKALRAALISAIEAYKDEEGKPIIREGAAQMADEMIADRQFEQNYQLVDARGRRYAPDKYSPKTNPLPPTEVRPTTKEDRILDLSTPVFNTPAPDEVHIVDESDK